MGGAGALLLLVAAIVIGGSIWGVFNRRRSILCAIAGALTLLAAGLGGLHAWGESRSIPWTTAYLTAAIIGIVAIVRQIRACKQNTSNADQANGGEPRG
ncbi:MAG TPA: hypothetical protein PKE12_07815 [Kiritimatiellia bacterium]|nr:hypothetical protein [Kiritimatiellia bacterium]